MQNRQKRKEGRFRAVGLLLLLAAALALPAGAQGTVTGTYHGTLTVQDAGSIPQIKAGGEDAYSMFAHAALPDNTPFLQEEGYEDAGMEALLYAGYPIDGLGLQKKYGVSGDFARVVTQQAIWSYIEGWSLDSSGDSVRIRYIKELLEAAENQTPQDHSVSFTPENPSFQRQGASYRSETMTVVKAEGTITVHPENGVQVLSEDGAAVKTLRQGDRFILLVPAELREVSLQVTHQFAAVLAIHYMPQTDNAKMDHLLQAVTQVQTRSGIWRFALPEESDPETQPSSEMPSAPSSAPAEPSSTPPETTEIDSPSTGGAGMPLTASALLGLCWVITGLIFLGKRSRNGDKL